MRSIRGTRAVVVGALLAAIAATAGINGQSGGPTPILLVVDPTSPNPFGGYLAEILRAEGLQSFEIAELASLDAARLSNARLAILAEAPLTAAQATLFTTYVQGGGRLVAMRPDARIASLLGITPLATSTANGYVLIDQEGPGAGLQAMTLPFKGTAAHYDLAGATAVAALYSGRDTPTAQPAVVTFGRTAAWAFDLARSTAYTRQGDPAFAGQERDGVPPIRTNDIFFGTIDLERVGVPHADVQMRLFARVVASLLSDALPLPRLWYFPGTSRTLLVTTGDSHTSVLSRYTPLLQSAESYGARISLYPSRYISLPASTIAAWRSAGHEVGLHPYFDPDGATFPQGYQIAANWFTQSGWAPWSPTERHHSLEWQNWTDPVPVMAGYGIRMDTSYYAWGPALYAPDRWHQAHGYITGSGRPMRFVDATGNLLPVYQQDTQLTDEQLITGTFAEGLSPEAALVVSRQLIDGSQEGAYSALATQFHIDYYTYGEVQPWVDGTMAYAQGLGIPMWTAERWLRFVEARAATQITNIAWSDIAAQLSFSVGVPTGAPAQTVLVPSTFGGDTVTSVQVGGVSVTAPELFLNGQAVRAISVAPLASGGVRGVIVRYGTAPPAPPTLSITDVSVPEGAAGVTTATLTVSLSALSTSTVTASYQTANGTATSGSDYVTASGTVTFLPNTSTQTILLSVLGDTAVEPDETFTVVLSNPINADLADAQGVVTIQDDDAPPVAPVLTVDDVLVTEGHSGAVTATFTLALSQPSGSEVSVGVATAPGTALAGIDYVTASGTVTFAPGSTSRTFGVSVLGDVEAEGNETFFLNLSGAANATIGDAQGVGTILNDDTGGGPIAATFEVAAGADDVNEEGTALAAGAAAVWVGNASSATASYAGFRFAGVAIPAGATIASARVEVNASSTQWMALAFEFAADASTNSLPFTATSRPSQRTLLPPRVAHASNQQWTAGTWYPLDDIAPLLQAVVNQPGWTPGNAATIVLRGTAQAWARKFVTAFEGDATRAARLVVSYVPPASGLPTVSVGNASVAEADAGTVPASFTVSLSAASTQTVTVAYTTADVTATAGTDYVAASGTVTFAPGITEQTVTVNVLGDTLAEANETFTVTLGSPTNATIADGTATGTITNDDAVPTLSIGDVALAEGHTGTTPAAFTVTLSAASGQPVTVGYATADGSATAGTDYTAATGTLTFAPGVTTQTVSVPVVGDTTVEPAETFTVTLTTPTNATIADGTATGTITNDDAVPTLISVQDVAVAEGARGNTALVFTFTLSTPSGVGVSFSYATRDGSAVARSDYKPSSGTVSFAPGTTTATVRIQVIGDRVVEPDETFFLDLAGAVNGTLARVQAIGTIVNDDP